MSGGRSAALAFRLMRVRSLVDDGHGTLPGPIPDSEKGRIMDKRRPEAGFTLIELVIVCLVIGILVGMAVPNYSRTKARAARASCVSNQRNIFAAATLYAADNRVFNLALNSKDLYDVGLVSPGLTDCPDSHGTDHEDYDITIEAGVVTAVRCTFAPVDHVWSP
jgi:prepilin-type N-terminal cleavage/methylation domain-containing protein